MLKESRNAVLKQVNEVSIHGQISCDLVFTHADDPAQELRTARIGPEAIIGAVPRPGDRVRIDYLLGVVVQVARE
jgi:hypothetical protein